MAKQFAIEIEDELDLAKVAEVVERRRGRDALNAFISSELQDLEPDDVLMWLFRRTWRAIYTTNYDRVIQRGYEKLARPTQRPVTFTMTRDLVYADPRFQVPVYHLHGLPI